MYRLDELAESSQRVQWKDVVTGVNYLHSFKPLLVHGDLKPVIKLLCFL